MSAKHWTGLFAIVLLASVQVQGSWWMPELETAVEAAAVEDAIIVQRDEVICYSPVDCFPDECCLANARQSAKTKRWFFDDAPSEGVCQRLGTDGSACSVDGVFPDPAKEIVASDLSPCASEFICVAGSCEPRQPEPENTNDEDTEVVASEDSDNDEEPVDNDTPSETDDADNDDTNNDNADESEPVSEEKKEEEEEEKAEDKEDEEDKGEEWEEEKPVEEEEEVERPLENTNDDFPEESVDEVQ